jgi:hypothetical protein
MTLSVSAIVSIVDPSGPVMRNLNPLFFAAAMRIVPFRPSAPRKTSAPFRR